MAAKTDLLEEILRGIVREVNQKGNPAEAHSVNKLAADIFGYLQPRKDYFSGEIDFECLQRIFQFLRVVFHTEQKKLQHLGIGCMQRLLEDERFSPNNLTGESRHSFPEMFVNALAELCLEGSDDTVVEILRVSLQLACQPLWMQDPYALMKIIMFCMQVCGLRRSVNVKTAASATNVQAVTSFCKTVLNNANSAVDSVLPSDFQTVLTFFGDNLENLQNFSDDIKGIEVLRTTLLSIYTILRHTSKPIQHHPQFQEYVWRKITPALCHWLGKPAEMYMQSIARHVQAAAGLTNTNDMEMIEIKLIAQIFVHLARTYSRTDSMRCVLGSLLQRMASVVSVRQRLYTLSNLIEVLDSPHFLAELEGPNDHGFMPDTCLIAIVSETLAKLARIKHHEVETVCTKLALAFLTSLEHLMEGTDLAADQVAGINNAFARLGDTSPPSVEQLEEQAERLATQYQLQTAQSLEEAGAGDLENGRSRLESVDSIDAVEEEGERRGIVEAQTSLEEKTEKAEIRFGSGLETICPPRTEHDEIDSAARFLSQLTVSVRGMISKISTVEVDEAMQQFASDFCEDEKNLYNGIPYVNADAVYVATYQVLRFTVRGRDSRYYGRRLTKKSDAVPPMPEKEFISGVLGCGLLVYMSHAWIREVHQTILDVDILSDAGYMLSENEPPLIQTIRDIEGIGRDHPYLGDCVRLESVTRRSLKPERDAGTKLARYLVGRCWKGLEMSLQSVFLDLFSRTKLLSIKKELTEDVLQLMCSALGGLQRYADLCARLHLFDLCSSAYALLARVCCSSLYPSPSLNTAVTPNPLLLRLHPWSVLSIDVVLRRSLEMGSHNPECWKAFFTCYLYLHRLETKYLMSSKSASLTKRELQDCSSTVADITTRYMGSAETKPSEALDVDHSYMALGALLNSLDQCFVEATQKLNLTNLCNFIRTLGGVLLRVDTERIMLMERLTNVVILSSKCGRPLLHVMIVWATAIPFLYQTAASRTPVVSEKAVSNIHALVAALTSSVTENQHFHFNELQLKPYESLVCTQVCSTELQELIVYSLCNLVETSKSDIKSGWKSLFCTLRGIQIDSKSGSLLQAVSDVYEAYLNSDSIRIYTTSLWECIQSLLKLYRTALDSTTSDSLPLLGQNALKYIGHSMQLMFSLHLMSDFPGLVEAARIRAMLAPVQEIDFVLAIASTTEMLEEHLLEQIYVWIPGEETRSEIRTKFFTQKRSSSVDVEAVMESMWQWNGKKGILMAVHIVVDGLINGLSTSWSAVNSYAVETIIEVLRNGARQKQYTNFCLLIISTSLVPVMQKMLRRKNSRHDGPFQQLIGLLTELVADIFAASAEDLANAEYHLDVIFHFLAECLSCSHEATVKLGSSCVRHLVTRMADLPTTVCRESMVRNLLKVVHVAFVPLQDLMSCYSYHSKSIYGDTAHIKIAVTNDSSFMEMQKMRQNAYQIFLTEPQRKNELNAAINPDTSAAGKSFAFLVYPSELDYHVSSNLFLKRIPVDVLVNSLMCAFQTLNVLQYLLNSHTEPSRIKYLGSYERLMLLCIIRHIYTLACDFDNLSGLKFLIKRVFSSPYAINLCQLVETSGNLHTTELINILLLQRKSSSGVALFSDCPVLKLEDDMMSMEAMTFFEQYYIKWAEHLVQEYLATVSNNDRIIRRCAASKAETTPTSIPERLQETEKSEGSPGLVEVTLSGTTAGGSAPEITGVETRKRVILEIVETIHREMKTISERPLNSADSGEVSRKNPFRESVTSPLELPSDVAVELQTAIEEDVAITILAKRRLIYTVFEIASLPDSERVLLAVAVLRLCKILLEYNCSPDDEMLGTIQKFLMWIKSRF
ncbi:brefeldin A-inhibited guanine nucleotide-exchange protein 3-like [Paramacrobiotus metropolitanus]|uniref:brefeldin A-inhibited guanine nucleotide-exchange protein 3-like n=1 Tax=Paramacrobiotus metropolitanus TaxID=2943436 RepID=UPI0024461C92|nr:brefeldin A-inhibited guanine nucleotide-exchange protein 3-like [Paramacrobiotus metropolitanus]